MTTTRITPPGDRMTLMLCFAVCVVEGADIVSMGLVAPQVARTFRFSPGQMGWILTAAIIGLMAGAAIGGRLGDRFGRRVVTIVAIATFGLFSLATTLADGIASFVVVRALCGLGLGAALPNLIAIAAEAARPERRATAVGLMFAGQPAGGTSLALFVAVTAGRLGWSGVFYIGGVLPLLLLPVLALLLREPTAFVAARNREPMSAQPLGAALFGEGRRGTTLLMWAAYGLTQVIVYLFNSWLPTLMVAKGFSLAQAGAISAIENAGAVAGCVFLAMAADRWPLRRVLAATYVGIVAGLIGLAVARALVPIALLGALSGFCAIGGQLLLYTLAPTLYSTLVRATGTGAAVSVGRLGGIAGPLAAAQLLALGVGAGGVLIAAAPCALIAGLAAAALANRPRAVW